MQTLPWKTRTMPTPALSTRMKKQLRSWVPLRTGNHNLSCLNPSLRRSSDNTSLRDYTSSSPWQRVEEGQTSLQSEATERIRTRILSEGMLPVKMHLESQT